MEIESLLNPISEQTPSGPDLEYDQEFLALDQAARGKAEQQFGDTIVAAEEPSWPDVRKRAEALFSRSKDIRIAVPLVRALARQEQFVGLAAGLTLIKELLNRFWDSLHPMLDVEDGNDPTMRVNALSALSDDTFIRDVRNLYLVNPGRQGKLTVKDILIAQNKFPAGSDQVFSTAEVEGILRASAAENNPELAAAKESFDLAQTIYKILLEQVGSERAPELKPLRDLLKSVAHIADTALNSLQGAADASESNEANSAGETNTAVTAKAPGELRSREDALRLLDRVCDFMERTEPSHPAPLFIRRAQRLMNMSFVELIQELAPDGLSQLKNVAGLDRE